jgi:hypothetical protein
MVQKAPEKKMPSSSTTVSVTFAEGAGGGVAPTKSPVSFVSDTGKCLDSLEESCMFGHNWDQRCDQQRVGLCVNVLRRDLEAVEAAGFRIAKLRRRFGAYAISNHEEGDGVRDKMLFTG